MNGELMVRNVQRAVRLDIPFLRRIAEHFLEAGFGLKNYSLGVQFVGQRRMAEVNWQFLRHEGPTDVITFDYRESKCGSRPWGDSRLARRSAGSEIGTIGLHGDMFICPAVAKTQAQQFRTSMYEELVRYLVHGILHLRGYDDRTAAACSVMKREEGRWLQRLRRRFDLHRDRNPLR